jgi:hypothetical protein
MNIRSCTHHREAERELQIAKYNLERFYYFLERFYYFESRGLEKCIPYSKEMGVDRSLLIKSYTCVLAEPPLAGATSSTKAMLQGKVKNLLP